MATVPPVATAYHPDRVPIPANSARSRDLPVYAAVLLGYILLLPPQLNLNLMGSVLPPYRLFLIPSALFIAASYFQGRWRFVWPDMMVLGATAWICLALFQTTERFEAFTASFAQFTDIALAYLFARSVFTSLRDLRIFLLLMSPGLGIIGAIMIVESVTNTHILQPFFADLLGQRYNVRFDQRLGLMRARGPFPHPILAGIFMASFLPLYFLSGLKRWPWIVGVAASCASFFTVSSAALLALTAGSGLVLYNWLSERFLQLSWKLFFFASATVIFVLELGSNSGSFNLLMRFGSLNSYSAYNRVLIWRYGTQNVEKNPWFGIGYEDWERPDWMVASIDHYWLILAIQYGIIPPVLIALALIAAVVAVMRRSATANPIDARFMRGIAIAVSVFALGAVSVALWLQVQVWFFMLIAITVSAGYGIFEPRRAPPRQMPIELEPHMRLPEPPGRRPDGATAKSVRD